MSTDTTDRQLVWIVLAIVAALVLLPTLSIGFGMMGGGPMMGGPMMDGGMWGTTDAVPGWMLVVGFVMQFLFLAAVVGAVYFIYRAVTGAAGSSDRALEELRQAYARGDLTDEEFERRRERLEADR